MDITIVPLGTRGWMPHQGRETMCTLVKIGTCNFLLDCGTGISRLLLAEVREIIGNAPINIIFSHYHLDHFAGIVYLPGLLNESDYPVRLIGPSRDFIEFGLKEACDRLTSSPLSSLHYGQFPFQVEFLEFGPEGIEIEGIPLSVSMQPHPGGSVSIRIMDSICCVTDISASVKDIPLAKGVDCLIHETWSIKAQSPNETHSSLTEALERAKQAEVNSLIPTHFGPKLTETDIQSLSDFSTDSIEIIVPIEGEALSIEHVPTGNVAI